MLSLDISIHSGPSCFVFFFQPSCVLPPNILSYCLLFPFITFITFFLSFYFLSKAPYPFLPLLSIHYPSIPNFSVSLIGSEASETLQISDTTKVFVVLQIWGALCKYVGERDNKLRDLLTLSSIRVKCVLTCHYFLITSVIQVVVMKHTHEEHAS